MCLHARIARFAAEFAARRLLIAYSGGVDSTVLLHMASQCPARARTELVAVHVNHGLHADAGEWERFCRRTAKRLGVACRCLRVDAAARRSEARSKQAERAAENHSLLEGEPGGRSPAGEGKYQRRCGRAAADGGPAPHFSLASAARKRSPEEAARDARYAALKTLVQSGDLLMTAHHRDDQAETVLLQLLRGGGPAGLAGMPACARFGAGRIVRPLLGATRAQLERYARDHRLEWLDDPANDDLRYDRNYVRRRLAPVLCERWPGWRETLARAARHQAEARALIGRVARRGYLHCRDAGGTLSVARCLELHDAEKKAVLRHWLERAGLPTPSEKQLLHLSGVLVSGDAGPGALARWPGAEVRHYRGKLYAMTPLAPPAAAGARRWRCGTDLDLPEINAKLTWRQLRERAPELTEAAALTVRLRRGGEKCAYAGGRFHKRLKKVFQELGVPPWERDRVPLVYLGDELRVVWSPLPE